MVQLVGVPDIWRDFVWKINEGNRLPDGMRGIRDVDAPCDVFEPAGEPGEYANGTGECLTDGHYMCVECVHIDLQTLRRRRDECVVCGAKLGKYRGSREECDVHCAACGGAMQREQGVLICATRCDGSREAA